MIAGNADARRFACPWCGAAFTRRPVVDVLRSDAPGPGGPASLEGHWQQYPACAANRGVNNPTQSKYDVTSGPVRLPDGEDRDA